MAKRRPTFDFINLRGEPVSIMPHKASAAPVPAPQPSASKKAAALSSTELETLFDALCVAGCKRNAGWLASFCRGMVWQRDDGNDFSAADVLTALQRLGAAGRVQLGGTAASGGTVPAPARNARLHELLARPEAKHFWRVWLWAGNGGRGSPDAAPGMVWLHNDEERIALARLVLASGMGPTEYNTVAQRVLTSAAMAPIVLRAFGEPFDPVFAALVAPALRWGLLVQLDQALLLRAEAPALCDWLEAHVTHEPAAVPASLRLRVAEWRLHRGEIDAMRQALAGSSAEADFGPVFEADALAWQGRWAEAASAGTLALKQVAKTLGRKRSLLPTSMLELHLLALLAGNDGAAWNAARKLALTESGSRAPAPHGWGLWAHAIAARLGEEAPRLPFFEADSPTLADPNALILAAWLGLRPKRWTQAIVEHGCTTLRAIGLPWKAELLLQAAEKIGVPRKDKVAPAWPVRYFGAAVEPWREALAVIGALAPQRVAAAPAAATLQWRLSLDTQGRITRIEPFERSQGARGPGKAKAVPLSRLTKSTKLDARDAAVARCIKVSRWSMRDVRIDTDSAALALVGHPNVVFADTPEQPVDLRESLPTLEVRRETQADGGERYRFRIEESLLDDDTTDDDDDDDFIDSGYDDPGAKQPASRLRVVAESADRARLIRITPTQRQVAELAAREWSVPLEAQQELDAALQVLAGHFLLHSDAQGGEAVAAEPRLRAQFTPRGDALALQLLVRPFGDFGPTLPPGNGRARLHTLHAGQSLATARDLDAERGHLRAVLEALPFLGEAAADAHWLLDDPEQALAAVEAMASLPAVASIEWPKGQPLTLLQPPDNALQLRVKSERDWFAVDGELQLDEHRVLGLKQLLALLDGARSQRYVALGEGRYLALTQALRRRLDELAALGSEYNDGLRLPGAAAAWLAEAADELGARGDGAWQQRAQRLEQAATLAPTLPSALQAELRPYQADGWAWMMRLAHAGFGAVLADDMGLGKTVQTLALLLARADDGPALVVAPTSVCSNWVAEALRFAPSLQVHDYDSAERGALLGAAGPGDVVVASYALLLRDAEAFAQQHWGTLVLDEAQALKNAATKRAQAVATLQAGFRLGLTGTPVENRLSDLWSLMNLLNPGLLGSAARFTERFANPIERQRDDAARARLRRIVAPFLLRRTKAQVLTELPPRTEIVLRIEPGNDERSFLEATRQRALERVAAIDGPQAAFHVLAELTRLRRAACDPRLVAPELGMVGSKVLEFERLATELVEGRHQALVFSQFTDFLKLLGERLAAAGIAYQYLDGSTPAAARAVQVAAFQRGDAPLFLISLKAGGFGLNLTAADYVIIADPWWNPAAEDQASGRAHRIGQQRPVTVYRLVMAGSIEERIVELHRDKRALADSLLEGQDGGAPLAAAELLSLLKG